MVVNLAIASHVAFIEQDVHTDRVIHNDPLDLEAFVHKKRVRMVLIDGGARINICNLKLINELGYSHLHINPTKRINIKAYD